MGIVDTLKGTLESRNGQIVMAVVSLILAMYSSITMITTLTALQANSQDIANSFDNWRKQPYVEIVFLDKSSESSSANIQCPTTHPEAINSVTFPGVQAGLCVCRQGASFTEGGVVYDVESSLTPCDRNQTRVNCVEDTAIPTLSMPLWEDSLLICAKRGGEAAVPSISPYRQRPQPTATTPCPSGYRLCGSSSDYANAICFPSTEPLCPFTGLLTVPAATFNPANYANGTFKQLASGSWLVASRQAGTLPVVEDTTGLGSVCVGKTTAVEFTESPASITGTLSVDTSCPSGETSDPRFAVFASMSETVLLTNNMNITPNYCDATGRATVANSFSGTCDPADSICTTVKGRSKCDKLKSYSPGASAYADVKMFFRREIAWKADCEVDRRTVVDNVDPLLQIINFTTTVTVINVLTNVFGIILYINLLLNLCYGDSCCCPFDHDREKALIKGCKTWVDTIAKLARFVPLALLASQVFEVSGFWQSVSDIGCTDATSQASFVFLSERLSNAYRSYALTLGGDALSLVLSFYAVAKALLCPKVEDLDDDGKGEGEAPTESSPI